MKKTAKPKNSNRGKPRRRVVPFWRHRHFRIPLVLLLVGLALVATVVVPKVLESVPELGDRPEYELRVEAVELVHGVTAGYAGVNVAPARSAERSGAFFLGGGDDFEQRTRRNSSDRPDAGRGGAVCRTPARRIRG